MISNKHKYAELFAPSLLVLWPSQKQASGSIPICMSKKPLHWNNSSLSFVPETTDNYIQWKNNILMDNLAKANVQL